MDFLKEGDKKMYDLIKGFTAPDIYFLYTMNQPVRLSRVALIRELMRIKDDAENEPDLFIVVEHCIEVLSKMTDEEYAGFDFKDEYDMEVAP